MYSVAAVVAALFKENDVLGQNKSEHFQMKLCQNSVFCCDVSLTITSNNKMPVNIVES